MTRDRSLDEFLGSERRDPADDESEPERTSDAEGDSSSAESGDTPDGVKRDGDERDSERPDADDAIEPAVSTYEFSPDGAPCAVCGGAVEKRWRDDGELVCPDCKAW